MMWIWAIFAVELDWQSHQGNMDDNKNKGNDADAGEQIFSVVSEGVYGDVG